MKRLKLIQFGLILLVFFSTTSCYRKLYFQCSNDKLNYLRDIQNLTSEKSSLEKEKEKLSIENSNLKQVNAELTAALETEKKKTKKFDLFFRQLCCDGTTEKGADEVYITVLGSKLGSGDIFVRAPGGDKHWDMNNGNQGTDNPSGDSHCLTNRTVVSGELKPGEAYYFNVAVCEEDRGTSKKYQEYASDVLQKTGDPFSVAAGAFINTLTSFGLFITDKDDWMGMFGLKVSNTDGLINVEWVAKEGLKHMNPDPSYPLDSNRKEIRMTHDGSNYVGWFGVRY